MKNIKKDFIVCSYVIIVKIEVVCDEFVFGLHIFLKTIHYSALNI